MVRFLAGTLCGVALALALPLVGDAAPSQEDARAEKAREMMRLSGAASLGKNLLEAMMGQFEEMGVPEAFSTRFLAKAHASDVVDLVVPVYVELLDARTMDQTITFYRSPAGQALVAAQPEISRRSMEIGQAWGERLSLEVVAELEAEQAAPTP